MPLLRLLVEQGKRTKVLAEHSNSAFGENRALDYFRNIVETVREPLDSDLERSRPEVVAGVGATFVVTMPCQQLMEVERL